MVATERSAIDVERTAVQLGGPLVVPAIGFQARELIDDGGSFRRPFLSVTAIQLEAFVEISFGLGQRVATLRKAAHRGQCRRKLDRVRTGQLTLHVEGLPQALLALVEL